MSVVTPSDAAVKFVRMRCRSTGYASALMSSVVTCDAAVEQRPGLAAEDEVLHRPRAGAPAQPVA